MSFRLPLGLAAIVTLATLGPRTTRATLLVRPAVAERATRSDTVILGRVEATRVAWENQRIVTHSTVATERALAGSYVARVEVVTPGGTIDGVGMRVIGGAELGDGARRVLFLSRAERGAYRVLDLADGALEVERGADGSDRVRDDTGKLRPLAELAEEIAR